MDKLPYRLEDDLRTEVAAIQHPLINALIGTQLNYNDSIFLDLRTIHNAKAMLAGKKYVLGNDGKEIKVVTRIPDFYIKTRNNGVNIINERVMSLSLKSIVEEADKSTPFKEYKYTVDLSRAIPYDDDKGYIPYEPSKNGLMQLSQYTGSDEPIEASDFEEYTIKIPFYVKHNDIDFINSTYTRDRYGLFNFDNIQDIKIQGIELEFDTVVPEDSIADNRYEKAYIYPPYVFGLQRREHNDQSTGGTGNNDTCIDSNHVDSATGTAAQYSIPNVLSGRHCKYVMTFAKSKNRYKTFTHADMMYDSICHSPSNGHKCLSYYEYLKLMRGGYAGGAIPKDVTVGANNYYSGSENSAGDWWQYAVNYPLPLHVSFEFGYPQEYAYGSEDNVARYDYNIVGWLVIRTYRGYRHFMPGNLANFIQRTGDLPGLDVSPETFMNMDLWANFLKTFTCKISIPRKVPSLILKLNNGEYRFLELYTPSTTKYTNTHKLNLVDSKDPKIINPARDNDNFGSGGGSKACGYIRPFIKLHSSIILDEARWNSKQMPFVENMSPFGRYIKSIGGFNGFLLPAERRAMHYSGSDDMEMFNPKLIDGYKHFDEEWK